MGYLGLPYAWGGGGTNGPGPGLDPDAGVIGFDCSGLTQYAYAQAGISIPRNSRAQYAALPKVASNALRAGDLVFWANDPSDPDTIRHVAIYLGDGKVVQAPQSGDVVKVSTHVVVGLRGRGAAYRLTTAPGASQRGTSEERSGARESGRWERLSEGADTGCCVGPGAWTSRRRAATGGAARRVVQG